MGIFIFLGLSSKRFRFVLSMWRKKCMEKKKKKDMEATMPAPLVLPTEESISESPPTSRPASSRTTLTEAPEEDLEETPVEELPQDEETAEDGENIEDEAAEDMEETS